MSHYAAIGQYFRLADASGGELDVVADPARVNGRPKAGGIVSIQGWVSGILP